MVIVMVWWFRLQPQICSQKLKIELKTITDKPFVSNVFDYF